MPSKPLRRDLIDSFLLSMATRDIFSPPENLEEYTLCGFLRLVGCFTRHDSYVREEKG
jgi:hypothetical protein